MVNRRTILSLEEEGRFVLRDVRTEYLKNWGDLLIHGSVRGRLQEVFDVNQGYLASFDLQRIRTVKQLEGLLGDQFGDCMALLASEAILQRAQVLGLNEEMLLSDILTALDVDIEGEESDDSRKVARFTALLRQRVHDFTNDQYALSPENIVSLVEMKVFREKDFEKLQELKDLRRIDFRPFATKQSFSMLPDGLKGLEMLLEGDLFDDMWEIVLAEKTEDCDGYSDEELKKMVNELILGQAWAVLRQNGMEKDFQEGMDVVLLEVVNQMGWRYSFTDQGVDWDILRMAHLLTLRIYKCVRNTQRNIQKSL